MSEAERTPQPPDHFESKHDAIQWILEVNALNHKEARTAKSDTKRVYFKCTKEECHFSCHINKSGDGLFRVTRFEWHTCGPFNRADVKRAWVAEKAKELLSERQHLWPRELVDTLREKHGVEVKPRAATKAVAKARKLHDDEDASFDKLQGLFQALREQNPGTVAEILIEEGRFVMAFLCPGPCARAWSHCPKIIALDGTHGKSSYNGVLLVATALDGAGEIFPIAVGFVPSETNVSWGFFVRHLADALNIRETPLTVISDRCNGIDNAVSEFLPRAAHSYCAFHISKNVAQYGQAAAKFVWRIANACSRQEYDEAMASLLNISPKAHAHLKTIKKKHWVRAFFPMPRYGHVTSNIAESTNSALRECRKCPPTKLFIMAIRNINAKFAERREKYASGNETDIAGKIMAKLVKRVEDGRKLEARRVSGSVFDVQSRVGSDTSRTVDLERRQCTCMKFQDYGYPCNHACAAALLAGVDITSLCIDERRVGALRRVYEMGIIPVDIETILPIPLEPPLVQRLPGRPKVKRIRRRDEDRRKRIYFCSLCGETGHTKNTCPENYA